MEEVISSLCSHCMKSFPMRDMVQSIGFDDDLFFFYTAHFCPECAPTAGKRTAQSVIKSMERDKNKKKVLAAWKSFCDAHNLRNLKDLDEKELPLLLEFHAAYRVNSD